MEAYLEKRQRVLQQLNEELALAHNYMKQYADRRSEREFNVGDLVYLKLRHTHQKALSKGHITKLSPKFMAHSPLQPDLRRLLTNSNYRLIAKFI